MRPASTTGVTIALLAVLLAGCTGTDRAATPTDLPPIASTPAAPDLSNIPAPSGLAPSGAVPGGPAPSVAVPNGPEADDRARIALFRSGGFAGRGDAITVEPDGRWTVVDRAGGRRTGKLDTADLGRLRGLAADPRLSAEARRTATTSSCADAFSYRLTVGSVETGYVDCPADPAPPPATRALVELLLKVTA
ncbi:hypothetical protein [Micromonospora sp. WMMD736]|uniref:hypothetical protein n=1 Tax=Micromonospora sp. WMMD736 TaxID=3404112 RepID=UPI003B966E91